MRVGHSVGLSYRDLGGGKFMLRWRQDEVQPDGTTKRVQRTKTVYSVDERRRLVQEIEAALNERGWWDDTSASRARPLEENLELIALEWVKWKVARGVSVNTKKNAAQNMRRWFRALRRHLGIPENEPVGASAMTQSNFIAVLAGWRTLDKYADGTIHRTSHAVLDMWSWAHSQAGYQTLPRPPYRLDDLMPMAPIYIASAAVPTLAECDAVIRRIRQPVPRTLGIIMRYTGIRLEQAVFIHREDLDFDAMALQIRKGKSRREKAELRTVQAHPGLFRDLGERIRALKAGPLFPDARQRGEKGELIPLVNYRNQTRYVTAAWVAATAAGEAREAVWRPRNREINRPNMAFRAAFQGHLHGNGVDREIVRFLVGHRPGDTGGQHYASPQPKQQRAAVELLDPIDWGPDGPSNVVAFDPRWKKVGR